MAGPGGVQRTVSSPKHSGWSSAIVASRNSSSTRHEPGDRPPAGRAVDGQRRERRLAQLGQPLPQDRDVLGDRDGGACRWSMPTVGGGLGRSTAAARSANRAGSTPSSTSGSSPANRSSSADRAREAPQRAWPPARRTAARPACRRGTAAAGRTAGRGPRAGRRPPRARLGVRQQPRGLEVEQGGRDDEELRGLVEVGVVAERGEVGDEVVGDAVQRQLGDVELVLADELQEQVERAGEVVEADGEPRRGPARR